MKKNFLSLLLLIISFNLTFVWAQDDKPEDINILPVEDSEEAFDSEKVNTIQLVKDNLTNLKKQMNLKEKMLGEATDKADKLIIDADLDKLKKRYDKTKLNLISVITNIQLGAEDKPKDPKKRDLMAEAQQLIGPALDSFHRISAKPRRIESLKNRIAFHEEQIILLDQALQNLDSVKTSPDFQAILPEIAPYISDAIDDITDKKQEHHLKIESLSSKLLELTKDKKSVWDAIKEGTKDFLSTRGKNLFLSFMVFWMTFWPMLKFREKALNRLLAVHPDEWYVKPVKAFYGLASITLSFGLSLFTLSALGDWVLVTLTILAITAILWASKNYLPKYLTEFKLILNFGTIKEGELVVYEGLPWKVKSIGFQTVFENEFLDSQLIRIQISEIVKMHSRKILPNEQWFPSRTGDWVLLNDGVYGQIVSQTLEKVVLEINGVSRKYFQVQDYLALFPTNMKSGFVVEVNWSVDYLNQSTLFSDMIPKLKTNLSENFKQFPYQPVEIQVSFAGASVNSLDLYVMAKFEGAHATHRSQILRDLNSLLLQISIQEKWNIPFNQLVIHQVHS
ncbi:MAG: hypothetical protein ACOYL6_14825 [Bacteriovoracaceae bacterium]